MKTSHDYFAGAATFDEMAAASSEYGALLSRQRERADIPAELLERVQALGGGWHLLAISEDWCIDSQSSLPAIAAFADAVPNLDLRLVGRDANPELIDAHLTNGTSRAIPVVILLDAEFRELAWWGPRPAALQRRVATEWKVLEKPERNWEIRRWYAIDKGRSALEELVALLERAAAVQATSITAGV